jgi:hypothetical protein
MHYSNGKLNKYIHQRELTFCKIIYPSEDAKRAAKVFGFALSPYKDSPAL